MKKAAVAISLLVLTLVFSGCISKQKQSTEPTEKNPPTQETSSEEERTEEQKELIQNKTDAASELSEQEQPEINKEEHAQDGESPAEESIAEETPSELRGKSQEETSDVTEFSEDTGPYIGAGIELPDDPIEG